MICGLQFTVDTQEALTFNVFTLHATFEMFKIQFIDKVNTLEAIWFLQENI